MNNRILRAFAQALLFVSLTFNTAAPAIAHNTKQEHSSKNVHIKRRLPLEGKIILVDPGHGGSNSGYRIVGYKEKYLNLSIAYKFKRDLEKLGADVIMTRYKDTTVTLAQRVAMINRIHPNLFISVHCNASGDGSHKLDGIETYYFYKDSKHLATSVYNALVHNLPTHGNWVKKNNLYVVDHTSNTPSILAEVGYMTNWRRLHLLVSQSYQTEIASALTQGIVAYFHPVSSLHVTHHHPA